MAHIQALPWVKFAHEEYLFSEFRAAACSIAKAAYFELLCFAMKQTPALSLPNNDRVLAGWIGLSLKRWERIKNLVLSQFTFSPEDGRYYSPMLTRLYSDSEPRTAAPAPAAADTQPRAMTGAERARKHRDAKRNATVTASPVTRNAAETASNAPTVTPGGIKGGDPESKPDQEIQKPTTTAREHLVKKPREAFAMHFGWQPQQPALDKLLVSLQVDPSRHTPHNLAKCIAHYQAKPITNTQPEWEVVYANWLARERMTPEVAADPIERKKAPAAAVPPAPVRLADDRPQWQIFAERQAAKAQTQH